MNQELEETCHQNANTTTCQIFNNPTQYERLTTLNEIQLFGSVVVIGIIPLVFIVFFGINTVTIINKYIYDTCTRFYNIFCCNCYKSFCAKLSYVFCYGEECNDKNNTANNNTSKNQKNDQVDIV
jgi:hypothetical protein